MEFRYLCNPLLEKCLGDFSKSMQGKIMVRFGKNAILSDRGSICSDIEAE